MLNNNSLCLNCPDSPLNQKPTTQHPKRSLGEQTCFPGSTKTSETKTRMFCFNLVPFEFLSLRLGHTELPAISKLQLNLPREVSASGSLLQETVISSLSSLGGSDLFCGLSSLVSLRIIAQFFTR